MTTRAMIPVVVMVILPLGIATWILGSYTLGESLSRNDSCAVGLSVALLATATAAYLFLFAGAREKPHPRLGVTLAICGTACILAALALQFYVVSVSAENSRRAMEILGDSMKTGSAANVHWQADIPQMAKPATYFALFAGIWLAAVGIRIGVGHQDSGEKAGSDRASF